MGDVQLDVTDTLGRRVVRIDKPLFTLGRRSQSDLRLVGTEISREHAEIACEGDQYVLRDRQSRYGTFVNNEAVGDVRVLRHGDRIRLGRTGGAELTFLVGAVEFTGGSQAGVSAVDAVRQVAALLDGLRALGSGHVLDEVLSLVLDAAIDVTGAERGFIMLANPSGALELRLGRARGRIELTGRTFETSHTIPERVFATGQTEVASDLQNSGLAPGHLGTIALGIRHVLCAPLKLVRYVHDSTSRPHPQRIGVLYLDSREKGALLSATTRAGLEALATEAAVAIENARLYRETLENARLQQELTLAAEIQRTLLPDAAYLRDPFSMVGRSIPCRSIGGDFFDYFDLSDGSVAFALGDVAGKGPAAALLAAALQATVAAHTSSTLSPAATLTRVNEALIRRAIQNRFATMFYGVVSPGGRLTYCNAGHNPPILFTCTGVRRLEEGGLVLGLFQGAQYQEDVVQLAPGDVLVLFSDGVSEALNQADEEFGDERIIACIEGQPGRSFQQLLDALIDSVRQFSEGTAQRDDVTALVLSYQPR